MVKDIFDDVAQPKTRWGNALYTGEKSYNVVGSRNKFFAVSVILCIVCIILLLLKGLNLGIDFKGGTVFTVSGIKGETTQQIAIDAIHAELPNEEPAVSNVGNNSIRVQVGVIDSGDDVIKMRDKLAAAYGVTSENVSNTAIGPTWGASIGIKAIQGLIVFLIACALFMTIYFRSWRMAVSGLIALLHDLIITAGIYALVGWEITPASIIGFLTILGYSMYDTVVVFDKVRENTANITDQTKVKYLERANLALNQTLVRSINTSVVALLPIGSILFFGALFMGAGTLRDIALALFVGMAIGAYSSIFLATPMEVAFRSSDKKINAHNKQVDAARALLYTDEELDEANNGTPSSIQTAQLLPGKRLSNSAQPVKRKK